MFEFGQRGRELVEFLSKKLNCKGLVNTVHDSRSCTFKT